jgi:hypothetical protein
MACFDISVDKLFVLLSFRIEDVVNELLPRKLAARGPSERCSVELYGL